MSWPDPILRLGLYVYRALWWLMLPIIYLYLRRRARADPLRAGQPVRDRADVAQARRELVPPGRRGGRALGRPPGARA